MDLPVCVDTLCVDSSSFRQLVESSGGDPVQVVGTEVLARCLQHETDHLDGVLFIDRMDAATRKLAMREIRASNWDGPVKISPHRTTDRIF